METENNNDFSRENQTPDNSGQPGFDRNQPPAQGQYQQQPQQFQQYGQPAYGPGYTAPPPTGGKGAGITSIILGAIGMVYSSVWFFVSLVVMLAPEAVRASSNMDMDTFAMGVIGIVVLAVFGMVFVIPSLICAFVALGKKCRGAIWIPGLITSALAFIMIVCVILFAIV